MDRRYLVKNGRIEVIDRGRSRGTKDLDASQLARLDELASSAAVTDHAKPASGLVSDGIETNIAIRPDSGGDRTLQLRTGDDAPAEVWDLIGEVSRFSGT